MPFNEVVRGDDGAHYVKKSVEVASGDPVEFIHNLGKKPTEIVPVWCNEPIQLPQVESETTVSAVLKFIPNSATSFVVVIRFK